MTFYAGYSEANRIPTPLELGCSNPQKPCLLEGFLVSDPPLQQVVARTKEAGLRGNFNIAGGRACGTERVVRPPHGHASSAALGLSRPAGKAVIDCRVRNQWSNNPRIGSSMRRTGVSARASTPNVPKNVGVLIFSMRITTD
jgi:hypothetical protein